MSLCLHLNCSDSSGDKESTIALSFLQRKEVLRRTEELLWRVMGSEGRSEARLWLCTDIGSLLNVPRKAQASIFTSLLRPTGNGDGTSDELLCHQVLRVACEKQPRRVVRLFTKDSELIRHFFLGRPKRILDWFEKFSSSHKRENELGAQALAHFAFIHRDRFWNELEWKGSHGQAPATVASKPHYFLDLDVLRTVENFLNYVPEFWSSDELWNSLKEGDILSLDMEYFIKKLFQKMVHGSCDVWDMLEQFFLEEDFTHLCQRLLSFLEDQKLLGFLNKLSLGLAHDGSKTVEKGSWLFDVLRMGAECPSLECAMICNTCASHSRQLSRLLHDGENVQEYETLSSLLQELKRNKSTCNGEHWAVWRECLSIGKWDLVRWLALESWSIQVLVSKECMSTSSLAALLLANSIQFWHGSQDKEWKEKKDKRIREKKKKGRMKKKRRKKDNWSSEELESSHSDVDFGRLDSDGHWYLSFDSFSMGMEKDELPEQLSGFAFRQWLNKVSGW